MTTTTTAQTGEGSDALRRLILMRWLAAAGELALIAAAQPLFGIALPLTPMLAIVALLAGFNLVTRRRLTRGGPVTDGELFAQLGVDMTALTLLLFFSGGAANPLVSLYLPSIAIAAVVLPGRFAWGSVALSVAAYSLLVFFNVPLPVADAERATRLHLAGMWLTFVASAALIAWFTARMAAAIRSRDRQLAAAREAALRNERVVALGGLAAGAAHELGTPLATMAVLVDELSETAGLNPEAREDLNLLHEQVAHCKRIITGLAARAGQTRAEGGGAISLDSWLEQVIDRWRQLRPRARATVRLHGATPAPQIVSEASLGQALLNLFNNAADADAGGGEIEIEATWDAARLRLEVRDRGPGFDEKVLLAAGRAFVTTREEGTGIGLFLAHAAVERLGGRIALINREGGGAITRVELPLEKIDRVSNT
ncbi:MAG: sensor histidine kinase [Zoogloeaceae bacterium]|jgi:two-component system sensor histidine kinase RegB|nr:sensor histidine kinase [Zoogloeaceae bacterium]